jgi:hypothetical protein
MHTTTATAQQAYPDRTAGMASHSVDVGEEFKRGEAARGLASERANEHVRLRRDAGRGNCYLPLSLPFALVVNAI